jgi:hypothetical protein
MAGTVDSPYPAKLLVILHTILHILSVRKKPSLNNKKAVENCSLSLLSPILFSSISVIDDDQGI